MHFSFLNEIFLSVIIGIVQGITEFLPISSTAHLRLVSQLITGTDIGLSTSNFIQFGTLLAIIQFYRKDLTRYFIRIIELLKKPSLFSSFFANVKQWLNLGSLKKTSDGLQDNPQGKIQINNFDQKNIKTDVEIIQVLIATIPVIISALIFRHLIEEMRANIMFIAAFLLLGALLIFVAEIVHLFKEKNQDKNQEKNVDSVSFLSVKETLIIGLFQALAIFPGVSRSGATLAGALFIGKERKESVRFSFLLSIPALGLAGLYDLIDIIKSFLKNEITLLPSVNSWSKTHTNLSVLSLIIGFIFAYTVGYFCLKWLLKFLAKENTGVFIVYRILLASVIFALLATGLA